MHHHTPSLTLLADVSQFVRSLYSRKKSAVFCPSDSFLKTFYKPVVVGLSKLGPRPQKKATKIHELQVIRGMEDASQPAPSSNPAAIVTKETVPLIEKNRKSRLWLRYVTPADTTENLEEENGDESMMAQEFSSFSPTATCCFWEFPFLHLRIVIIMNI